MICFGHGGEVVYSLMGFMFALILFTGYLIWLLLREGQ